MRGKDNGFKSYTGKPMKYILAIIFTLLLAACAAPQVASNMRCIEVDNGNKVLSAANRFTRDNKRNPSSLSELVPKYLSELPDTPKVEYSVAEGYMRFSYYIYAQSEEFNCECKAKIGQKEFKCLCLS